jgi:hypothetical protein
MTKKKSGKMMLIISFILLVGMIIAVIIATYSWYVNQKTLSTVTWIKTPMVLKIGSGDDKDIKYLDLGNIDVESNEKTASYVFCVYGTPVDNYSLQLAYTTNIPFSYTIYRADLLEDEKDNSNVADSEYTDENGNTAVKSEYTDEDGNQAVDYFIKHTDENGTVTSPVIEAKPLTELSDNEVLKHQSHTFSYGDQYGENAINKSYVQSNAEPLYWLAEENNTNVLSPLKESIDQTADGTSYSLDYFILEISWKSGIVKNDKETDIVYLTASR